MRCGNRKRWFGCRSWGRWCGKTQLETEWTSEYNFNRLTKGQWSARAVTKSQRAFHNVCACSMPTGTHAADGAWSIGKTCMFDMLGTPETSKQTILSGTSGAKNELVTSLFFRLEAVHASDSLRSSF